MTNQLDTIITTIQLFFKETDQSLQQVVETVLKEQIYNKAERYMMYGMVVTKLSNNPFVRLNPEAPEDWKPAPIPMKKKTAPRRIVELSKDEFETMLTGSVLQPTLKNGIYNDLYRLIAQSGLTFNVLINSTYQVVDDVLRFDISDQMLPIELVDIEVEEFVTILKQVRETVEQANPKTIQNLASRYLKQNTRSFKTLNDVRLGYVEYLTDGMDLLEKKPRIVSLVGTKNGSSVKPYLYTRWSE